MYQHKSQNLDLRNDLSFFHLLTNSYHRLIGQSLTPEGMMEGLKPQSTYFYTVESTQGTGKSDGVKSPVRRFFTF
jgi:hypothetical protein